MSAVSLARVIVVLLAFVLALPALAQEGGTGEMPPLPEGVEVVAGGLNYPRLFVAGDDGTLFVPEVGVGGPIMVPSPEGGEIPFGYSSQVVAIAADGTSTPIVTSLPSAAGELGAADVAVTDESIWVVVNGVGPLGAPPFLAGGVYRLNRADGHLEVYIDMYGYEAANNPDGNDVDSNPTDIEIIDGTIYIVDTGANTLFTWTEDGGLQALVIWPENPVPTSVAGGPDGNLYVSFLGAEIAPGAGMVQQISPDGEILQTWGGYNALTDVLVAPDGTVYVVSLIAGFGEQGPLPGQVLRVAEDGGEVLLDGLMVPYGLAVNGDGTLLVSTGASFAPPGSGMILNTGIQVEEGM